MDDSGNNIEEPKVITQLIKMIKHLTHQERRILLNTLKRKHFKEKRRKPRKANPALLDYAVRGRVFHGFIHDISVGGVFIETGESVDVGQEILETLGYKALLAKDGKEAIEICKNNQDKIDLVVLDMIMPGMDGGVVFDRLRENNPEIKILLSSGYSINGQAKDILERGCDGFIQKPFNIKELSQKIREILDRK